MNTTVARLPLRFPRLYAAYLLACVADIVMTYVIVFLWGGSEVNAVADNLIHQLGHWGLILLKFTTVVVVLGVCEIVGHRRPGLGRSLAMTAIVVNLFPVGAAILQMMAWSHLMVEPGGP